MPTRSALKSCGGDPAAQAAAHLLYAARSPAAHGAPLLPPTPSNIFSKSRSTSFTSTSRSTPTPVLVPTPSYLFFFRFKQLVA